MKTTDTRPALLYRTGNAWKCETPGLGHHAGGDSGLFRTLKAARGHARRKGYQVRRCYDCDTRPDDPEYQFQDEDFTA